MLEDCWDFCLGLQTLQESGRRWFTRLRKRGLGGSFKGFTTRFKLLILLRLILMSYANEPTEDYLFSIKTITYGNVMKIIIQDFSYSRLVGGFV